MITRHGKRLYEYLGTDSDEIIGKCTIIQVLDVAVYFTLTKCSTDSIGDEHVAKKTKKDTKLAKILDGTYYVVESVDGDNIQARCAVDSCGVVRKGTKTSTGNFYSHYIKKHPQLVDALRAYNKPVPTQVTQPTISDMLPSNALEKVFFYIKLIICL